VPVTTRRERLVRLGSGVCTFFGLWHGCCTEALLNVVLGEAAA
jgi:hypothetical protein